jgi:flagellar motor switch protein FliN/FliY
MNDINFESVTAGGSAGTNDIIMDIPVALSVELGRAHMKVRDIMSLSAGAVIELEKKVEDPVEIYANGRLIGRGEVVVVENTLGIKITEVINK